MPRGELGAALRGLRRRPRLVGSVALVIGLGIAAATTMLAVADGVLRPLPWPNAGRIVNLWQRHPQRGIQRDIVSSADFLDWREQARSFERLAGWRFTLINLTGRDEPERVQVLEVTPDHLALTGVQPILGRSFGADENAWRWARARATS